MRAALPDKLMQIKDVTMEDAVKIRSIWHAKTWQDLEALGLPDTEDRVAFRRVKREMIDEVLRTHGVEFLGRNKRTGIPVYYCNAGDTYTTTIMFEGNVLSVGCWGYLVERNMIREPGW